MRFKWASPPTASDASSILQPSRQKDYMPDYESHGCIVYPSFDDEPAEPRDITATQVGPNALSPWAAPISYRRSMATSPWAQTSWTQPSWAQPLSAEDSSFSYDAGLENLSYTWKASQQASLYGIGAGTSSSLDARNTIQYLPVPRTHAFAYHQSCDCGIVPCSLNWLQTSHYNHDQDQTSAHDCDTRHESSAHLPDVSSINTAGRGDSQTWPRGVDEFSSTGILSSEHVPWLPSDGEQVHLDDSYAAANGANTYGSGSDVTASAITARPPGPANPDFDPEVAQWVANHVEELGEDHVNCHCLWPGCTQAKDCFRRQEEVTRHYIESHYKPFSTSGRCPLCDVWSFDIYRPYRELKAHLLKRHGIAKWGDRGALPTVLGITACEVISLITTSSDERLEEIAATRLRRNDARQTRLVTSQLAKFGTDGYRVEKRPRARPAPSKRDTGGTAFKHASANRETRRNKGSITLHETRGRRAVTRL